MSRKIKHKQHSAGSTTSECNTCVHDNVCRRHNEIRDLRIPYPYTVAFECEFYKKDK